MLPIPQGFFGIQKMGREDPKSKTLGPMQFGKRTYSSYKDQRFGSTTISPKDQDTKSLKIRQSLQKSTESQKMTDFLNKKKIPGLLDFLESKIH